MEKLILEVYSTEFYGKKCSSIERERLTGYSYPHHIASSFSILLSKMAPRA